jgi:hypothetical protein
MPFLGRVNKNPANEVTWEVQYHLLKQESVHGDMGSTRKGAKRERHDVLC